MMRLLLHSLRCGRSLLGQLLAGSSRSPAAWRDAPAHPVTGSPPLPRHQEAVMARLLARCDGCGLCDSGCVLAGRLPFGSPGPSHLLLQASRRQPPFAMASTDRALYALCRECAACSAWCPNELPVGQMLAWVATCLEHLLPVPATAAQPAAAKGATPAPPPPARPVAARVAEGAEADASGSRTGAGAAAVAGAQAGGATGAGARAGVPAEGRTSSGGGTGSGGRTGSGGGAGTHTGAAAPAGTGTPSTEGAAGGGTSKKGGAED